jgi:lipopolysaccharide transport system ATP-binding protein
MTDVVIQVEHLSKRYRIGRAQQRHDTLRDLIVDLGTRMAHRLTRKTPSDIHDAPPEDFIWALKDVSFEVRRGEVLGIIGRNGAGKSTLLKILARITEPTEGRAIVRGRVGSLLEVGTGFHPELTGRENIYLNGAILGMRKAEIDRKFDEIVAFAEIERFLDTPVKRYSSGMYVRLAFAVAAHLEPEILLVDEVLAVGDAAFQKKCLGKMSQVAGEGRTVLFVSHNMAAITQLCNRVVLVDRGQIKMDGIPQRVAELYLTQERAPTAERYWSYPGDAPGDERVRLLWLRVIQDNHIAPVIDINQTTMIEMGFRLLKPAKNVVTGVSFYDSQGVCLFAHCDWRPNELLPGVYRKTAILPGQRLAEGQINLLAQIVFYDPNIPSVVLPNALTFDAVDSPHPRSVRGPYKGPWPGIVRLDLEWSEAVSVPVTVEERNEVNEVGKSGGA